MRWEGAWERGGRQADSPFSVPPALWDPRVGQFGVYDVFHTDTRPSTSLTPFPDDTLEWRKNGNLRRLAFAPTLGPRHVDPDPTP